MQYVFLKYDCFDQYYITTLIMNDEYNFCFCSHTYHV